MTLSIGEAAAAVGSSIDTVRYYERCGVIPPIGRDENGRRVFGESDVAWLRYAVCLRGLGMGISAIARYVAAAHAEGGAADQVEMLRDHIQRMRSQHAELGYFIDVTTAKLAQLEAQ